MPVTCHHMVLDTNILVRGLINFRSHSGILLKACEQRRAIVLLSHELLAEYRYILSSPALTARYPELDPIKVKTVLERLVYVGDVVRNIRVRFTYPRDPKDEPLLTLASAGHATCLITTDLDLLDLPSGYDDASRRFRRRLAKTDVLTPSRFLADWGHEMNIFREP